MVCLLIIITFLTKSVTFKPRANFLPGSDRMILDTHPYFAFDGSPNTQPLSDYATMPCESWAASLNNSRANFGITIAGEFSNAVRSPSIFFCL